MMHLYYIYGGTGELVNYAKITSSAIKGVISLLTMKSTQFILILSLNVGMPLQEFLNGTFAQRCV